MDLKDKFVITISREVGSGGHSVGRLLAERLGVRFYDKELINALREKFNLTTYEIERLKGEKKNWLSDFFSKLSPMPPQSMLNDPESVYLENISSQVTTDDIYKSETAILKELAGESSCVIAGRSGFFALEGHPNKFDVFITAPLENRIRRVMAKQNLSEDTATIIVGEVDKMRENYVKRYTDRSRYDARNYGLCINMDKLTEEQAVEVILSYLGAR